MNKTELFEAAAAAANISKKDAESVINAALGAITSALKDGEKVQIMGFGSFEVKHHEATTARNPQTGEKIQVAAKNVPVFSAGKALKDAVNG
jgi:nucleoid DNA-binding protein